MRTLPGYIVLCAGIVSPVIEHIETARLVAEQFVDDNGKSAEIRVVNGGRVAIVEPPQSETMESLTGAWHKGFSAVRLLNRW